MRAKNDFCARSEKPFFCPVLSPNSLSFATSGASFITIFCGHYFQSRPRLRGGSCSLNSFNKMKFVQLINVMTLFLRLFKEREPVSLLIRISRMEIPDKEDFLGVAETLRKHFSTLKKLFRRLDSRRRRNVRNFSRPIEAGTKWQSFYFDISLLSYLLVLGTAFEC